MSDADVNIDNLPLWSTIQTSTAGDDTATALSNDTAQSNTTLPPINVPSLDLPSIEAPSLDLPSVSPPNIPSTSSTQDFSANESGIEGEFEKPFEKRQQSIQPDPEVTELTEAFKAGAEGRQYVPESQESTGKVDNQNAQRYNNGGASDMQAEEQPLSDKEQLWNSLEKAGNNNIIKSGARIFNPYSDEADAFAKSFYKEVKSFSTDSKKISHNTGYSEKDIQIVKEYLFYTPQFSPDCAIAHSWQRLMIGNDIKPHDLLLLKHELYEMQIKQQHPGIDHSIAHTMATKKYNYQKAADDYYGNLKKRKDNK